MREMYGVGSACVAERDEESSEREVWSGGGMDRTLMVQAASVAEEECKSTLTDCILFRFDLPGASKKEIETDANKILEAQSPASFLRLWRHQTRGASCGNCVNSILVL